MDTQTHTRANRLIESIGLDGRYFENHLNLERLIGKSAHHLNLERLIVISVAPDAVVLYSFCNFSSIKAYMYIANDDSLILEYFLHVYLCIFVLVYLLGLKLKVLEVLQIVWDIFCPTNQLV